MAESRLEELSILWMVGGIFKFVAFEVDVDEGDRGAVDDGESSQKIMIYG